MMRKIRLFPVIALVTILMSSCGSNSSQPASSEPAGTAAAPPAGMVIYNKTCVACHQSTGEGIADAFPPLAKSDFIKDKEKTILQVLKGYSGELTVNGKKYNGSMPAQQLNDDEIAQVLSYVYSSFGNTGAPVTADEVKAMRAKM